MGSDLELAREAVINKIGPLECPGWRFDIEFLDQTCSCGARRICLMEQIIRGADPKHHTYSWHLCINLDCRKMTSRDALCRPTKYHMAICPACRRHAWDDSFF